MLYKSFVRRALALHITTGIRSYASSTSRMGQPPQSYTLDRTIFNENLYSRMRDFWFYGLPENASAPPFGLLKMWWGIDSSKEQRAHFDGKCSENFKHALEALGPDNLALPPFESHEKDVDQAATISMPLLTEVKEAQAQHLKKGADTLLALILILDQMSRNIYRDAGGLRLVFGHFDRLALTLLHASMKLSPNPVDLEEYRLRPVIKQWYLMPLMHSEHLLSHELFSDISLKSRGEVGRVGDQAAVEYLDRSLWFEEKHVQPLRKFGRYPHRNAALGRESTKEETEELRSGDTFGVGQDGKDDKSSEKSEL